MIVYLDDMLVLEASPKEGEAQVEKITEMLSQQGFVINKKS